MNIVEAIQTLAFRDVQLQTPAYRIRSIQRWYSMTFATPLRVVEHDIPIEEVLLHYYEHLYETAEAELLEETKKQLLETDDQRLTRLRSEDAEAAFQEEFHAQLEQEAAQLAKHPRKTNFPVAAINPANPVMPIPEARLPDTLPKDLPPDIEMRFVSPEELERDLDDMGSLPIPRKSE